MNGKRKPKKQKKCSVDVTDAPCHIDMLPDEILFDIFDMAVSGWGYGAWRVCKRWKVIWSSLHDRDLKVREE
jgi:hypothetical protein